jgi:hypothetical protein
VVDLIREAKVRANLRPFLVSNGQGSAFSRGAWHVAQRELVSATQALLQTGQLFFAALPERALLVAELFACRMKAPASADDSFEAWRDRAHDDLALAVALALWCAERVPRLWASTFVPPEDWLGLAN